MIIRILSLAYVCQCFSPLTSKQIRKSFHTFKFTSFLSSSLNDDNVQSNTNEEVLMQLSLSVNKEYENEDMVPMIQQYLSSFPFAAVLPVQPLTYTPREDGRGVTVSFLRKKTEEKSSIDGGIGITFEVCDENQPSRINITAKRISNGQVISKVFSEAMIIKTFVNGLNSHGVNIEKKVGIGHKELLQKCRVESIFHRWM